MQNNKVLLLLSGGIDSTVLLYWLLDKNYDVNTIHINYGQKSFKGEKNAILSLNICKENHFTLDIPHVSEIGMGSLVGELPNVIESREEWFVKEYFPNRNMILISIAAAYAYKLGCNKIALGVVGQNSYSDTSVEFIDSIKKALISSFGADYQIIAPFVNSKREVVVEEAVRLKVPLTKTFSCNALGNRHCLFCTSCIEREKTIDLWKTYNNK